MTVTFYSNFLNQIQKPFCDEMYTMLGEDFAFVSTTKIPEIRLTSGYPDYSQTIYNILAYNGSLPEEKARTLSNTSDVVIFGANSFDYVKERIHSNKVTIYSSERFFKRSDYMKFNPRILRFMFLRHTRFRNKNLHLLCASAFLPNDAQSIFAYPQKMYKWGYFTKLEDLDINALVSKRNKIEKTQIIWVARFIKWKHPELMVYLGLELRKKGYDFSIKMIGGGEELSHIKNMIKEFDLDKYVHILGNLPNALVLEKMRNSHIFCVTSDRNEGWGAVLNEAMSNGCCVVASSDIGSVPYLVEPGTNGLVYTSNNVESLVNQVEKVINDRGLRESLSKKAYTTMKETWAPSIAAKNMLKLAECLLKGNSPKIMEGPCSVAKPISINWHNVKIIK